MEEQEIIETIIAEMDKFNPNTASAGEEVYIYRRLADSYDPYAIAMLNQRDEVIGYLDKEIAKTAIIPKIKNGMKLRCVVTGEQSGNSLPISISEAQESEEPIKLEEIMEESLVAAVTSTSAPDKEEEDISIDELDLTDIDILKKITPDGDTEDSEGDSE